MKSINPATGETIKEYPEHSSDDVAKIIDAIDAAQQAWKKTAFKERAEKMSRAAVLLRERKEDLSKLMVAEMGKVYKSGLAEIEKCAWVCDYYAENAEAFLQEQPIDTDARKSFVTFNPLGVVYVIMPWNFPYWQVFRFAAPGLMAGNGGLLKHAPNVPGCSLAIEQIFRDAGFPPDLFRAVLVSLESTPAVSDRILENDIIKAVTLTGSVGAGKAVASKAGSVLKKAVLELGGSDPYIVLSDADVELAASLSVTSRMVNSGQSCVAAKRFIVVESLKKEFEERVISLMSEKKMGDPMAKDTDIGPQARFDLRDGLHDQVKKSVAAGAKCPLGGEIPDGPGAYYPATVLTDVSPGMPAYEEELFGPVASIITAQDDDDAIRIANSSIFGLGSAIFTADISKGEQLAATAVDAGACFVNAFVVSDPRLPFGGIKQSGYGRELSSFGIKEFVNIKTVYVA